MRLRMEDYRENWRKFNNRELHDIAPQQILYGRSQQGEAGQTGNATSIGKKGNTYKNLVGKPERRPLGVTTLRRECKMKNELESPRSRVESVDWIDMTKDRIDAFIKFGEFLEYL